MGIKQQIIKCLSFVLIAASLVSLSAQPAAAQEVAATRYVSTTGVDDAASVCDSALAPCLTINYAISKAVAGDTIKVAVGTYTGTGKEVVLIDKSVDLSGGWSDDFSSQTGLSAINGEDARRGVYVSSGISTALDHFEIHDSAGGINSWGTLTVTDSVIRDNVATAGGGIRVSSGSATVTNTTLSGNQADQGSALFGSVVVNNSRITGNEGVAIYGSVVLNNSTVSGNNDDVMYILGRTVVLNNTTISGNSGAAIRQEGGSLTINNSTITGNITYGGAGGLNNNSVYQGTVTVRNSIIAGNKNIANVGKQLDCQGPITSAGYNLIGIVSSYCTFTSATGDLLGTAAAPIDAKLGPLADNGGPTPTHALLPSSPAINAGNPATPGGGDPNACLPTDQRGLSRPAPTAGTCDMGAYEIQSPVVMSVSRAGADPTGAPSADYQVTFSGDVTGVDTEAPFSDFLLTGSGVTGAAVTAVSGSGSSYTVSVNTGTGAGTLRLDVIDDDTIVDTTSGAPLAGSGTGNGNFTSGQAYTLQAPVVSSITLVDASPTSASSVQFTVTFSQPVSGVDTALPFGDFSLTTAGVIGASIQGVLGSDDTYTVTVGTGTGNGTIRLDLVDDDSIVDNSRGTSLGGAGASNGSFTSGQVYSVSKRAVTKSPGGTLWDTTPTYKWTAVPDATQYRFQLIRGTAVLYTKTAVPDACNTTICSSTPTKQLIPGSYKWRVQALLDNVWASYSPDKTFTLKAPKAGYWKRSYSSYAVDFYVSPSRVNVNRFGLSFYVSGCQQSYKVVYPSALAINNHGEFLFPAWVNGFYAYGKFNGTSLDPTAASGRAILDKFFIAGCGRVSGNAPWAAAWVSSAQPASASVLSSGGFIVTPMLGLPTDFLNIGTFELAPQELP